MMKLILFTLLTATALFGGFFSESNATMQTEKSENARLCKLFTLKAEQYKKTMRSDELAFRTLKSYEDRARRYCDKAAK